jgi:hypothetical protein
MRLLDTGSVIFKILFAIFVPGPTTPGVEVITKLDVARYRIRHQSTSSHCLDFMPKAS